MGLVISGSLKAAYSDFYRDHDEAWRVLGAKYKAQHIIDVCHAHHFDKVLEVGAGDGSILKELSDHHFASEYSAVEISKSGAQHIRSRGIANLRSAKVFDGYHLSFEDNAFDVVILSHVLEHVEYPRLLLNELKRVAAYSVIEVPCDYRSDMDKRIKHFLSYGHINMYTPVSLRYLLMTVGFEIENDMTSMIEPSVTRYNAYINQKKPKSLITDLKIVGEYAVKQGMIKAFGKRMAERMANAYTVLCRKAETQPKIF
jgi:ubiquinone/menaquinone biosynthesis C-methylase UbiE